MRDDLDYAAICRQVQADLDRAAGEAERERHRRRSGGAFQLSDDGAMLAAIAGEDEPLQARRR